MQLDYFFRKKTSRWKNDIVYQTIQWDVSSTEADIEHEFGYFVKETLIKNRYKNYVKLFQSNYFIDEGERTYVIKIFRTQEDKENFLQHSEDIILRSKTLSSTDFNNRWGELRSEMIVEDIYNLLPELADFKARQVFYTNRSELRLGDRWLSFDLQGRLLNFGIGNTEINQCRLVKH